MFATCVKATKWSNLAIMPPLARNLVLSVTYLHHHRARNGSAARHSTALCGNDLGLFVTRHRSTISQYVCTGVRQLSDPAKRTRFNRFCVQQTLCFSLFFYLLASAFCCHSGRRQRCRFRCATSGLYNCADLSLSSSPYIMTLCGLLN